MCSAGVSAAGCGTRPGANSNAEMCPCDWSKLVKISQIGEGTEGTEGTKRTKKTYSTISLIRYDWNVCVLVTGERLFHNSGVHHNHVPLVSPVLCFCRFAVCDGQQHLSRAQAARGASWRRRRSARPSGLAARANAWAKQN